MKKDVNMLIEVWSDFLCPWCYIGKSNLESAIRELGINADVVDKSFQTQPDFKGTLSASEVAQKYGLTLEQQKEKSKYLADVAKASNVELDMDSAVLVNTLDAHRLAHFAKQKGVGKQVSKRLFEASYQESKNVADHHVLADIASEFGIDREETLRMLHSDQYKTDIQSDIKQGNNSGVQEVPFFVINKKYSLSGAQPKEKFLETFQEILKKDGVYSLATNEDKKGYSCDDTGCQIPQK